jgi:hypothetical protein
MVDRTDIYIRPRGYYDNKGNLLNVGFDTINGMPADLAGHKTIEATASVLGHVKTGAKIINFTRDMTADSGDVAYTGVGFKPRVVIFLANKAATKLTSIGFSVGAGTSNNAVIMDYFGATADTWSNGSIASIALMETAAIYQIATLKTLDADGFTLTWTKAESPSAAIVTCYALCLL